MAIPLEQKTPPELEDDELDDDELEDELLLEEELDELDDDEASIHIAILSSPVEWIWHIGSFVIDLQ